jgi:excisionase family DNA binding protein
MSKATASLDVSNEQLLTVDDVAEIYKVHPQTVRHWARDGKIKPVRVGSRVLRFRREEVLAPNRNPAGAAT